MKDLDNYLSKSLQGIDMFYKNNPDANGVPTMPDNTPMKTPDTEGEKVVEEALDILHEAIQHTPIKLSETNGTEYDKGYIFYQDMVVRDVLDNTPKLKKLLTDAFTSRDTYWKERVRKEVEGKKVWFMEEDYHNTFPLISKEDLLDNLK